MCYMEQRMQEQIEGSLYNDEQKYSESMTNISERKRVTLEFFEQLRDPERMQAIENFDEGFSDVIPKTLFDALCFGFGFYSVDKDIIDWVYIVGKIHNNTYHTKPFDIETLAKEMFPIRYEHNSAMCRLDYDRQDTVVKVYNKLKSLGKIKE